MTFEYRFGDAQKRFALGVDHETGGHFLSCVYRICICNYEEFYGITPAQFLEFQADADTASQFAAAMQVARICEFGDPEALLINIVMAGNISLQSMAPAHSIEIDALKILRRQLCS